MITIEQFKEVEMRVGQVVEAIDHTKSEKLIRLVVDFGEAEKRVIFTAVRPYGYDYSFFLNKKFLFVSNLEHRRMMGEESQGMILAVDSSDDKPIFISAEGMPVGARVR